MSLQVWLPMTKDLRQQGLSDVTVTNNGATFNSAGKLGGCYAPKGLTLTNLGNLKVYPMTIAFWCKTTNTGTPSWESIVLIDDTSNSQIHGVYVADAARLKYEYNPSVNANSVNPKEWHHYTFIINNGNSKVYVDGILNSSSSEVVTADIIGRLRIGVAGTIQLNDFRIYDHALSPMEVKELSKGLVLHYPLSDEYIESTTNLVTTEDGLSNTCYNGATSKYGYGTNTDMYKTLGVFEGRKSTKVYMGTAGLSAYPYVYFDNFNASGTTIQTLSFDYYPTIQNTLIPYSYNGSYNFSYTTDKTSGSASNVSQITIPVEVGRWNHITVTAQKADTTNTSRGIGYIRIGSASHTSTTSNYWLFGNVQVEAKDHATGYAGVGGTRNSSIVYDNSGFCNNGTISGALTIASDTPKYKASTYMPKATLITHPRPVFGGTDQEWTCAMWVKLDIVNQSGIAMNNFNYGNNIVHAANSTPLLYLNGGTNDYYMYGSQAVSTGVWTHVVFVFKNSDGTRNIYINGVLKNSYGPNRTSTPSGIQDVVTVGTNLAGYISDYRVYATALSPTDVKSLYQNCATIDADGTIHGQIRS